MSQAEYPSNSKLPDSQDNSTNPAEKDTLTDFPVYEIVDSADDSTPTTVSSTKPVTILLSFDVLVGPPKFYGKRFFIDIVDLLQVTSDSASNPIVLENGDTNQQDFNNSGTPVELVTIDSDPSSPEQFSTFSTDESLRMAIDNFEDHSELDSELFNAELENFLDKYRNYK